MDYKQLITTTVLALVAGVVAAYAVTLMASPRTFVPGEVYTGSDPGNLLAEQYDPYVQYNGGYNSEKPLKTTGDASFSSTTISTFKGGQTGTQQTRQNTGTCYLAPSSATIAATTTIVIPCQGTAAWHASGISAIVGVTSGDNVIAMLSTTTASGGVGGTAAVRGRGLRLDACTASTTSGYFDCSIDNLTGGTYTWPQTGTASGTASFFITK